MSQLPTGQTSIEELRRRLQLAESLATGPQQQSHGPVGAGLRGLAQILAAKNATKLTGEVAGAEKAQRKANYAILGEMLDNGKIDPARFSEFTDDKALQVALALYGQQSAPKPYIKLGPNEELRDPNDPKVVVATGGPAPPSFVGGTGIDGILFDKSSMRPYDVMSGQYLGGGGQVPQGVQGLADVMTAPPANPANPMGVNVAAPSVGGSGMPSVADRYETPDQARQRNSAQRLDEDRQRREADQAERERQGIPTLTPGQEALDKAFAADFNDFVIGGGIADVEKNLGQLRAAQAILQSTDMATGGLVGMIPKWIRDSIPGLRQGANAEDMIKEVVQRNLRLILGAQFTEKEGELLMARALNPRQQEEVNIVRVGRLMQQIQAAAEAKVNAADYFMKNGTLQGFVGKATFDISDFDVGDDIREGAIDRGGDISEGTIIENDAGDRMIMRNGQWAPM